MGVAVALKHFLQSELNQRQPNQHHQSLNDSQCHNTSTVTSRPLPIKAQVSSEKYYFSAAARMV